MSTFAIMQKVYGEDYILSFKSLYFCGDELICVWNDWCCR